MKTNKVFFLLAAAMMLAETAFAAGTYEIDGAHSYAGFTVKHFAITKVKGAFKDVSGTLVFDAEDLKTSSLGGKIAVASINTNNEKRDAHLKGPDFFDVEKYPEIIFLSKKIIKRFGNYVVIGNLVMHGVERAIEIPFSVTKEVVDPSGKIRMSLSAELRIDRRDFDISWNKVLDSGGVVISNEVVVELELELVKQ